MRRTGLIALAALAVVSLVCVAVVSFACKPSAITVQHVKAVQSGSATTLTFEITNNTAQFYRLDEFALLDVLREGAWKPFNYSVSLDQINFLPFRTDLGSFDYTLGGHASRAFTSEVTNLPEGSALRLEITFHKRLTGAQRVLKRIELRLNPFDKSFPVFGSVTEASDAFESSTPPSPSAEGAGSTSSVRTASEAER